MIILKLTKFTRFRTMSGKEAVIFRGTEDDCSEGYQLTMPARDWKRLSSPEKICFIASETTLYVAKGNEVSQT